jgi:hypothetical protein
MPVLRVLQSNINGECMDFGDHQIVTVSFAPSIKEISIYGALTFYSSPKNRRLSATASSWLPLCDAQYLGNCIEMPHPAQSLITTRVPARP